MREIDVQKISAAISDMVQEANYSLNSDVIAALLHAEKEEKSPIGQKIIKKLIKNQQIAHNNQVPICQDTGSAIFFVDVGQELRIVGGDIGKAIDEGVRIGYQTGYLRKSIVDHPFNRINTGDNTPAVVHYTIVPGEQLRIRFLAKGGGSENMSASKMLTPAEGISGVKQFVLETVSAAGGNPCPPLVIGVGIGGTYEKAALLAKEAQFRKIGEHHQLSDIAKLEEDLLNEINRSGVGPQGLGGTVTAIAVNVEIYPTHIASLPVSVNLGCHASRHKEIVL